MAQRTKRAQSRGKKNRKHGRWGRKPSHQRYLARGGARRNKLRRIARLVRLHGWKPQAFAGYSASEFA